MTNKQRILILCTGNSCRSQMAEGWLRHLYPDRVEAFSAGAKPAERVHPLAIRVMAEVGIDLSEASPKHLIQFVGQPFAKVLTTCDTANESCPVFPGPAERFHHDFYDPANAAGSSAEQLEIFRHVRDEIKEWVVEIMDGRRDKWGLGGHHADPIDKAIYEAIQEGKFNNLSGSGAPFPPDDHSVWAEEGTWAAARILKSAGFSLPWIEERKDIEEQIVTARASLLKSWRIHKDMPPDAINEERWQKALATFRERGADINRQIRTYNLKAPVAAMHLLVLDVEREIGQVAGS